ncbi:MAG: SpoIIE family protein phosphatase [Acidimicrobiia bacterium]|nr:SpoIIE family protein phosphatase [Acidimicrobiia bacterium]
MNDLLQLLVWLQLPVDETSPSQARDAVKQIRHELDGAYDDVLVAVSELVTNAVRHADTGPQDRIDFRMYRTNTGVRVEVGDSGAGFSKPPLEELIPGRDHGWGLPMVEAIADTWGIESGDRTTVWLEVSASPSGVGKTERPTGLTRSLVDAAFESLITLDGAGIVMDWNATAADTFRFERDEAVGHPIGDLIIAPTDDSGPATRLRSDLGSAIESTHGQSIEMSLIRRGGVPFPALVRLVRSDVGGVEFFHLSILDVSAQKRSEEAREGMLAYLEYLADASEVLASSLDTDRTLRRLARLVVPTHADWCTINLVEDDGRIRRVAAEHADPQRAAELARLLHAHPNEPDAESGVSAVIRTGEALLFEEVDDALLAETANDPEYLEITAELQIRSCVIAPLEARGRILGSISLVYTEQDKTYDPAALAFAEDLGRRAGLAIDNATLYEQRDRIAMTLQRSLLPPYLPDVPHFELTARYEPAGTGNEVGGDFYDAFEGIPGVWNLVVGDVEGKGPEAASLIGLARHTLRAISIDHPSPADALSVLNQALLSGASDLCCTVALVSLDPAGGTVTVARAGHPAPLMLRSFGSVERLGEDGTLLGAIESPRIHETTVEIRPGDNLVMFTDGVLGSRALTADELASLLSELPGKKASEIADEISTSAQQAQPGGLGDDIAILIARRDD